MKLTQDYFEARNEAMKWLNNQPEKRNYAKGLQILQKSGFKPSVAALLARNGEKEWTREKLKYSLRQMLQVYYSPDDPRFNDEDVDALNDEHKELVDLPNPEEDTQSKTPKPTEVEKLMEHYADYHKQRDIAILRSMGMQRQQVRRIFRLEGVMISAMGVVAGLLVGFVICFLQQRFGIVKMGSNFVVSAFPVAMRGIDFLFTFLLVMGLSSLAVLFAVRRSKI